MLPLKASSMTAANDEFCDILPNFGRHTVWYFMLADDSHEISDRICYFWKSSKIWTLQRHCIFWSNLHNIVYTLQNGDEASSSINLADRGHLLKMLIPWITWYILINVCLLNIFNSMQNGDEACRNRRPSLPLAPQINLGTVLTDTDWYCSSIYSPNLSMPV